MYDLLGIEKKYSNPPELIERTINGIGTSTEGKVSKEQFLDGLMKNQDLINMLSQYSSTGSSQPSATAPSSVPSGQRV